MAPGRKMKPAPLSRMNLIGPLNQPSSQSMSFESVLSVALRCEPHAPCAITVTAAHELPPLSSLLPALHNMGLQVVREEAVDAGAARECRALQLDETSSERVRVVADRERLCDVLARIFSGEAEDGRLNGLAVVAGLDAREVMLVRAYASYLRQTGWHMSLRYIADCLRAHPQLVQAWLALH